MSKGDIQEVPVLFGTDRKRDSSQPSVAFGSERDQGLSLGLAVVTVPKERKGAAAQAKKGGHANEPASQRHLALRCIQLVKDQQLIEVAVRRLALSKAFPNQAFVFVHGYNVSFDNAVRRAAQIAYDLKFDGGTFLFSWPSRGQFDIRAYFSDTETVDIGAEHLRQFLEKVVVETKAAKVHSLPTAGELVLLRALEKIGSDAPALRPVIGEIIEAAPDVDADVFKQKVESIKPMGANLTLYASASDKALWLSGWLRGAGARAGFISENRPLIVAGIDTIDITRAGTDLFGLNHDVYSTSPGIIADMRRIFESGERPPDKRTREFEPVASKEGTYWRLRPLQGPTP